MSIIEDLISDFFIYFLWDKIIMPFFEKSGLIIRLLFNWRRQEINVLSKKRYNGLIGFGTWLLIIVLFNLII